MSTNPNESFLDRPHEDDLAYIKYSAKELLFHMGQKIDGVQRDLTAVRLEMVTRSELTAARRWAIGATVAAASAVAAVLRYLGI